MSNDNNNDGWPIDAKMVIGAIMSLLARHRMHKNTPTAFDMAAQTFITKCLEPVYGKDANKQLLSWGMASSACIQEIVLAGRAAKEEKAPEPAPRLFPTDKSLN